MLRGDAATNDLNDISKTALITLRARVIEAESKNPIIEDRVGRVCLDRIRTILPLETQNRILRGELPTTLTRHIALRARKYDHYMEAFVKENPDAVVVSLGCGFDTRFWRASEKPGKYIELDLPEVIDIKRRALGDLIEYELIECSVLDESWIARIASIQKEKVQFLAEGLLMYLPKSEVIRVFARLSETFSKSQIVFEAVNERYTKGIWKKALERKMRRSLGFTAGPSFHFGLRKATDIEAYGENIEVMEEWSYFEDDDIRPKILGLFRHSRFLSRTQWTIKASFH